MNLRLEKRKIGRIPSNLRGEAKKLKFSRREIGRNPADFLEKIDAKKDENKAKV